MSVSVNIMLPLTKERFTFVRVDESVQHEDAVASVVHRPPEHRRGVVQLPEDTAADYEHQVVEDSQCHERQPLKQGSQEVKNNGDSK